MLPCFLGADIACFPYAHTFPELKQTLLLATKPGGSGAWSCCGICRGRDALFLGGVTCDERGWQGSFIVWRSLCALTTCSLQRSLAVIIAHKHRDPCEQRFFDALCGVSGPFTLLRRVPPQELHPDMVNEGICIMHLRRITTSHLVKPTERTKSL
jgi:hypothetical protein